MTDAVSVRLKEDTSVPRMWVSNHYPAFNALRAIAVSLVFFVHFGSWWVPEWLCNYFWVGVDLFFVLSGFLITGILVDSREDPRFFRNFYIRRALRIFPLFYAFFICLLVLTPILHLSYSRWLLSFAIYLGNFVTPFTFTATRNATVITAAVHAHDFHVNVGHFWSLCVEEQFYLFWPCVIWFARSRKKVLRLCVCIAVLTPILRSFIWIVSHRYHPLSPYFFYWSLFTRWDGLVMGAGLAIWLREHSISRLTLRRLSSTLIWLPLLLIVVVKSYLFPRPNLGPLNAFMSTIGYSLIDLICLGVVLRSLDVSGRLGRLISFGPLKEIGKVSYGFYVIHFLFAQAAIDLAEYRIIPPSVTWAIPLLAFAISLLLAKLSFYCLESPFLKLKTRLAPQWLPLGIKTSGRLHTSEPQPDA